MRFATLAILTFVLLLSVWVHAEDTIVIEPKCISSGELVSAKGVFTNLSSIDISCKSAIAAPDKKTSITSYSHDAEKQRISFKLPESVSSDAESCEIIFRYRKGTESSKYLILVSKCDIVAEAITMKNPPLSFSDDLVLEHITNLRNSKECYRSILTSKDMIRLQNANFSKAMISKLCGVPQSINLGVAAIIVKDSEEITPAPMLRIFLTPKSFLETRKPFYTRDGFFERIDVNLGYAPVATKVGSEYAPHLLVGMSYELNKYALFNIGAAFAVEDKSKRLQPYMGVMIDSNLLRDLGILSKTKSFGFGSD